MTWRFLHTGRSDGLFNMEFDQGLARELLEGAGVGTVRVYGWNPPAISVGWNQSLDGIDTVRAQSSGVDVVRRPTGGRAILHSEEVTYSVVMVTRGRNVLQIYHEVSLALIEGIRALGVNAALEKSQASFPTLYKDSSSSACFSSSGRYEIKVNGKKLVGSAQRRMVGRDGSEVVLQHGSVLLGPDHLRIADFLKQSEGLTAEKVRSDLEEKTTTLKSALGCDVGFDEVVEALRSGFEKAWGITFRASFFHGYEKVTA